MSFQVHGKGPNGRRWAAFFNWLVKKIGAEGLVSALHPLNLTPIPGGKVGVTFNSYVVEPFVVKEDARGDGEGYGASTGLKLYSFVFGDIDNGGVGHIITDQEHQVDGRFTRGWYPAGMMVWCFRHPASRTLYPITTGMTFCRGNMVSASTFMPLYPGPCASNAFATELASGDPWPCANIFSIPSTGSPFVWAYWDDYHCSWVVTQQCGGGA